MQNQCIDDINGYTKVSYQGGTGAARGDEGLGRRYRVLRRLQGRHVAAPGRVSRPVVGRWGSPGRRPDRLAVVRRPEDLMVVVVVRVLVLVIVVVWSWQRHRRRLRSFRTMCRTGVQSRRPGCHGCYGRWLTLTKVGRDSRRTASERSRR